MKSEVANDKYPSGMQKKAGSINILFESRCEPTMAEDKKKIIPIIRNKIETPYFFISISSLFLNYKRESLRKYK